VVGVHYKPAALDHGLGHLQVLDPKVEVAQKAYHVAGQHVVAGGVGRDLLEPESSVLVRAGDDLVELLPSLVELACAHVDDASVQLDDDLLAQPVLVGLAHSVGAELHLNLGN